MLSLCRSNLRKRSSSFTKDILKKILSEAVIWKKEPLKNKCFNSLFCLLWQCLFPRFTLTVTRSRRNMLSSKKVLNLAGQSICFERKQGGYTWLRQKLNRSQRIFLSSKRAVKKIKAEIITESTIESQTGVYAPSKATEQGFAIPSLYNCIQPTGQAVGAGQENILAEAKQLQVCLIKAIFLYFHLIHKIQFEGMVLI